MLSLALSLALSQLSCDDSDLEVPPPDPEVQWRAYAQTYCDTLAACCGPETQLLNDFNCVDNYLRRVVYSTYGTLPLNPWKLQRCLDQRRSRLALGCDTEISLRIDDCLNLVDRPTSGAEVLCGQDRDCPGDQYCAPSGCAGGKCAPRLRAGQACDGGGDINRQCRDGLVCRALQGTSGDFACQQPQEFMQGCFSDTDCGSHYDRHVACVESRCFTLLDDGQRCNPFQSHQCASGYCDPDTSLCAPLTIHRYCENRDTLQWTYDYDFDRNYSRY